MEAPPAAGSPPPAVEARVAVEVPTVDVPLVVMEPPLAELQSAKGSTNRGHDSFPTHAECSEEDCVLHVCSDDWEN